MRAPRPLLILALFAAHSLPFVHAADKPNSALALARQLNDVFIEVAERASASTVVVKVAQKSDDTAVRNHSYLEKMPEEWRREFEQYLDREKQRREKFGPQFNGEGSGIILREDGFILTNNHVVEDAERIRVKLHDGREYDAEVRGTDPDSDIAVLHLKGGVKGLPTARFADSSRVRVGEFAIAIGAPYELEYSVTFGHISAKGRAGLSNGMMDEDFLQTDANINPGNSGGPLVNLDGDVVGVNSMIRGVGTGICFAIPSNLAREIADGLIRDGRFRRTWLGVNIEAITDNEQLQALMPTVKSGVVITHILPDGPAAKSRLKVHDVVTAVDGRAVASVQQLRNAVTRKRAGAEVVLDVTRDGALMKIKVQPDWMPDPDARVAAARPKKAPSVESTPPAPAPVAAPAAAPTPVSTQGLGVTVRPINPELAQTFGLDADHNGVIVTVAERGNGLGGEGVRAGDLIYEIDGLAVKSASQFDDALKKAMVKAEFLVRYERAGEKSEVTIRHTAAAP